MLDYILITKFSNNKVDKYFDFSTSQEAQSFKDSRPDLANSFIVQKLSAPVEYWTVDEVNKTVSLSSSFLDNEKQEKIAQLKINRDKYLLQDYISHQAKELVEDENGDFQEGNLVYFKFKSKPTGNPASEPNSILMGVILQNTINLATMQPMAYIRYSCDIIEGETTRKGYVKLTAQIAGDLMGHAQIRNLNGIKLTNEKEVLIKNATTLAELEAIDITFNS